MKKRAEENRVVEFSDGQKFIGESRAPRVQIEYDVELYGGNKKVELPFVVGVMTDLSGDNTENLGSIDERSFDEIDGESFDSKMAEINPKLRLQVPDKLGNDGALLDVNLDFKSMQDFEPAEIARQIPELAMMLDARTQLKELITYMDGKTAAEDVIRELLKRNLSDAPSPSVNVDDHDVVKISSQVDSDPHDSKE
jgi:type VI secretion system protein ImpB